MRRYEYRKRWPNPLIYISNNESEAVIEPIVISATTGGSSFSLVLRIIAHRAVNIGTKTTIDGFLI